MTKINKKTEEKHKMYDQLDIKKMADGVATFKQTTRGGRLQSPFDLYCEYHNIIHFDNFGSVIVRDSGGYLTANEMWGEIEKAKNKKAYAERMQTQEMDQNNTTPEVKKLVAQMTARKCVMCPNTLTGTLKHYCSGSCLGKAKERGIYGREEAHLEALNAIA